MRLSKILVAFGFTFENMLLPFLFTVVPFLSVLIPIAFLFSVYSTVSHMSSDGELVALIASGFSLKRLLVPTLISAGIVFALCSICTLHLEAWGRRELIQFIFHKTQTEVDSMIRFKIRPEIFVNDFLGYVFYAEKISPDRQFYTNVLLAPNDEEKENFVLLAPLAEIKGSITEGNLKMSFFKGTSYSTSSHTDTALMTFEKFEIDLLKIFQEKILGENNISEDYQSFTYEKLNEFIFVEKNQNPTLLRKAEALYHYRLSWSFLMFSFALLGIVLGIQNQRSHKNFGLVKFGLTTIATILSVVLCRYGSEEGRLPTQASLWGIQVLIFIIAVYLFHRREKTPMWEFL